MKYILIIPDGCADQPQTELGGQTPLEAASTPAMDSIVQRGVIGRANHTPTCFEAGSAVANMSLLGYNPHEHYTGRAPLEAAAQGIELGENDWCIRCNLVTIEDQKMVDFTAGHISSEEGARLLATAQEKVADWNEPLTFVPGVSYRNLLTMGPPAPFTQETRCIPPHNLTGQAITDQFPRGPGSDLLARLMNESVAWFAQHPVNEKRKSEGQLPATNIWLWGLGQRPSLPNFQSLHALSGAMITAVDLLRGLAALIGWDRIEVEGATGYTDTDFAAKGRAAIEAIDRYDIVCVHIEAPDEASHEGDLKKKIESLEAIDSKIVAPILAHLDAHEPEWRILVSPDHPTYISTRTHTHGNVPFGVCGDGIEADTFDAYHESNAEKSDLERLDGWEVIDFFLKSNACGSQTLRS